MTTREERLKDIKTNPSNHRHTFEALQQCCMVGGALSLELMDAHEGIIGRAECDVVSGPCSCGATH